ncbi:CD225/dispanin family protein [Corynebacterium choanae]|uniref:Interferon-induced transmembrane protein n=1 Tax=Corynebacterium choanae TaxID=1862358 RepID=A0A3G6J8Q9_9CORY|nr:CD225/dispanin family protein [Corynebacterium choanae]AZA12840.1 Interferon-induced transmembrane protein [Corynebacterium choanae]
MTTPEDPSNNNGFPQFPQGGNGANGMNTGANAFNNPNAQAFGGYPNQGFPAVPPVPKPENYLVWAILTTLFCCLPLGIVSIVYSTRVDSAWNVGNYQEAMDNSQKAKQFAIYSAIGVLVFPLLYLVIFLLGGLASVAGYY